MSISPKKVWFDADNMWVELNDARTIGAPLAWFPRLMDAAPADRERFELSAFGIHWDDLDEDISIEGLLIGNSDLTTMKDKVA